MKLQRCDRTVAKKKAPNIVSEQCTITFLGLTIGDQQKATHIEMKPPMCLHIGG